MTVAPIADQRILVGRAATLTVTFTDQDGEPADPSGTVTISIVRGDGTVLVTDAATSAGPTGDGIRTYTLAAASNPRLDLLTATWTNGTTQIVTLVEVVGGVYFGVAEARTINLTLKDEARYPAQTIINARRDVENEFEGICGTAFVPRYKKVNLDAWHDDGFQLPDPFIRTIRSITVGSAEFGGPVAFTTDQLGFLVARPGNLGDITFSVPFFPYIYLFPHSYLLPTVIEYEYGLDRPPPEIKRAALSRLRERLNFDNTAIPDRATSFVMTDGGNFRLDTAGLHKTGNPEVDAALARYDFSLPGVA